MTLSGIGKTAEIFEVPFREAVYHRIRFVRREMREMGDGIDWLAGFSGKGSDVAVHMARLKLADFCNLAVELRRLSLCLNSVKQSNRISDEDIESAREYPVSLLVPFVRGKATAWCHSDRNPSLFHGTRKNLAVCPVCDKKFGPIDICIERDGMSFSEAVKFLAQA